MTTGSQWRKFIWSRPGMILAALAIALACGGVGNDESRKSSSNSTEGDTTAKVDAFVPADESAQVSGTNLVGTDLVATITAFSREGIRFFAITYTGVPVEIVKSVSLNNLKYLELQLSFVGQIGTNFSVDISTANGDHFGGMGTVGGNANTLIPMLISKTDWKAVNLLKQLTTDQGAGVAALVSTAALLDVARGDKLYSEAIEEGQKTFATIATLGTAGTPDFLSSYSKSILTEAIKAQTTIKASPDKLASSAKIYIAAAVKSALGTAAIAGAKAVEAAQAAGQVSTSTPTTSSPGTPVPTSTPNAIPTAEASMTVI